MSSTSDPPQAANEELARKLLELTAQPACASGEPALSEADAIVSHIEVNDGHGVGALLGKLFGRAANVLSIRSKNFYEGRQGFGDLALHISHPDARRDDVFWRVLQALGATTVKRVLAVPYFPDDALTALALKEIFGVPLCTYLMDDQNLCSDGIPDTVMRELLANSSLRLAISPELCAGYERKYGYRMWFLPPLVATRLILPRLNPPLPAALQAKAGVIVGNIWGQRWVQLLRATVRHSGISLRWFSNGDFRWLPCSMSALAADGVVPHQGPPLPDDQLVEVLRQAPFVVLPSGTLDATDDRRFIAQLSFPSRIPYILATSQAPILVLGNAATPAARFVTGTGIGLVAPYERAAFQAAAEQITRPEVNVEMRRKALLIAGRFNDIGAAEWIWQSLAKGEPVDRRYEEMLPQPAPDIGELVSGGTVKE